MTKLEAVRAAIIKVVPEIEFDCPQCGGNGWYISPDLRGEPEQFQCQNCNAGGKLLAREPRLSDVLVAIDKKLEGVRFATVASNGWMHFNYERGFWNMRTDDLSQQSEDTISFIHSLLCV